MKEVIEKYYCDNCEKEMSEWEYKESPTLSIRLDMPNPKSSGRQIAINRMTLCGGCAKDFGVQNDEEYHRVYTYSQPLLNKTLEKFKRKIVAMFIDKNKKSKEAN